MECIFYCYPAIFSYADDGISVSFPDLPGCFSCGDTDEKAHKMAYEALYGYLLTLEAHKEPFPTPTSLKDIHIEENERTTLVPIPYCGGRL